jgi:hypothetical protein
MRIELTDGAWAEFSDPRKITQRYRSPIVDEMAKYARESTEGESQEDFKKKILMQHDPSDLAHVANLMLIGLIEKWSFDVPIPRDSDPRGDSLADIPWPDYDALIEASTPMFDQMFPNFRVSNEETSPTSPSNA